MTGIPLCIVKLPLTSSQEGKMKKKLLLFLCLLSGFAILMVNAAAQQSKELISGELSSVPMDTALVVIASQPITGVPISVSPQDTLGRQDGTTNFQRTYYRSTDVTLSAPSSFNNRSFIRWAVQDGASGNSNEITTLTTCTVSLPSQNYTFYAVYETLTSKLSLSPNENLTTTKNPTDSFNTSEKVYTLTNTGNDVLDWSVSVNQSWVSLSLSSGSLAIGDSTTVTVSINSTAESFTYGNYTAQVDFTNLDNGVGNAQKYVIYEVVPSNPQLSVTPDENVYSIFTENRAFPATEKVYTLSNTGNDILNWSITADQSWVSISMDSGSLGLSESTTVTVSIVSSDVAAFSYGSYTANITFSNLDNGLGTALKYAICDVIQSNPELSISPNEDFYSDRTTSSSFVAEEKVYTVSNSGNNLMNWTASVDKNWVTLSMDSGSLDVSENTTLTVALNSAASDFTYGYYTAKVSFSNLENANGNEDKYLIYHVIPDPANLPWDNDMGDFEPADDTVFWAFEQPEGTDAMCPYDWISTFQGRTGILQVSCDTQNAGLKMTSIPQFASSAAQNCWKITVDYYSEATVSMHSILPALLLYSDNSNYQIREIGASFIGMGLTPVNSWQQWSGYLLSKGSPTGQLQLIMKNQNMEGNLYIDKITLSEITTEEMQNPVDLNVTCGDFDPATDTTQWGYERVFSTDSGMPAIRYSNGGWGGQNQMIWGYFQPGQTLKVTSKETFASVSANHRVMLTAKVYVYSSGTSKVNFQANIFNEQSMSNFNIGAYAAVENLPGNTWNTCTAMMTTQQDVNRLQIQAFNNSNNQQMILFDDINLFDLGEVAIEPLDGAPAAELKD